MWNFLLKAIEATGGHGAFVVVSCLIAFVLLIAINIDDSDDKPYKWIWRVPFVLVNLFILALIIEGVVRFFIGVWRIL